ncbi:MAG: TIGR03943 family protein [Clostridiaceae bacterium]|nr:TIGR03943 family protein [Clostridiaceae bacterium]
MSKINKEIVIKLVILGVLILSFGYFIEADILKLYIHPRYIMLVKFSVVVLIIMFMITLFEVLKKSTIKKNMKTYVIFLIPLFMIITMNSSTVTDAAKGSRDTNISKDNQNTSSESVSQQDKVYEEYLKDKEKKQQVISDDGSITVNDDNYAMFLNNINTQMSEYENKEVEIVGFIYRQDDMKKNTFVIARYMMVCCVADMNLVGVLCESQEIVTLEDNTWIKVRGKLVLDKEKNELIIQIENLEKVNKPDKEYIYMNIY